MRRILRALTFFGCVAALVSQAAVTPAQERPYDVLVAGGGAAAMAAQGNVSPRQVRLSELRDRLRAAGAIVP